ncbi:MAG: hypothetical protein IKP95_12620 [Ruminococcus sp.]|nr:hypothetical protein [Ruminococcus sp.]
MACFTVPAAEAIVTTIVTKKVKKNEQEGKSKPSLGIRFSEKLGWLNKMLWGGSGLLAFEHLWHGEITPFPPFLTGAENPSEMFAEMATNGVGMAALVTVVWAGMVAVTGKLSKRSTDDTAEATS